MRSYSVWAVLSLAIFLAAALPETTDEGITWYSLEEAQQLAREHDKKVLIYAEASWCGYCKKMEKEVFPKEKVIRSMEEYYYPVRIDIESTEKVAFNGNVMTGSEFAQRHRVRGTPTFFFVDKKGEILGAQPGFIPADVFEKLLSYVGSEAYNRVKFNDYMEENKN